MELIVTAAERTALEGAATAEPRVRVWKCYRAVMLLADGGTPSAVARALGCSPSSVYNWASAWRGAGLAGLREGDHGGGRPRLGAAGERLLDELAASDPQARGHHATGWTVPLLRTELTRAGYAASDRTVRRALARLGWRWKRPKFVLGRPDPAYEKKKGRSPDGRA